MARLDLERAPPTSLPLRFLLSTPVWGMAAGTLLLVDGEAALVSRWAPATLALVHAFTLGVLGNAMFGSLLQFLPAAAGVRVRGGPAAGYALHVLLNAGAIALVAGFRLARPPCLVIAAACLAAAFALLAAMVLPGLAGAALRPVRAGLGAAVAAGVATAALGIAMVGGLVGAPVGLPVLPWVDVHAAVGTVGWMTVLLASVSQVVMPMFQGTRAPPARVEAAWLVAVLAGLAVAVARLAADHALALRIVAALATGTFAVPALWRQWRAPRSRNPWLVRMWRAGLLALVAAALALAGGAPAVTVGALALGAALPWLVAGMQMEIVAFLAWIELHRRAGRGVRLPPVQALLPDRDKGVAVALQLAGGALLVLAAASPTGVSARLAGFALLLAYAALGAVLWRAVGRRRGFLATRQAAGRAT